MGGIVGELLCSRNRMHHFRRADGARCLCGAQFDRRLCLCRPDPSSPRARRSETGKQNSIAGLNQRRQDETFVNVRETACSPFYPSQQVVNVGSRHQARHHVVANQILAVKLGGSKQSFLQSQASQPLAHVVN